MILVFEMMWPGPVHAPGNSATIQTIARAYPRETVRVFAAPSHLAELRGDAALTACANVTFQPIELYPHLYGKTHIVSWGRFRQEFSTLRRGLATVPRDERCLVMLISATPTAILAARWLARLGRGRIGVQVGLHGNLNDINGWRPRNPLARAFDLRSALAARYPPMFSFLVLEEGIKLALSEAIPAVADRVQVLPLPINTAELAQQHDPRLEPPVRIGLVGQATRAKGIDLFLDIARDFKARHGDRVEFVLVGRAPVGSDLSAFDILEGPVTTDMLPRDRYLARLAGLHYVFLPLQEQYYQLSASGALIDAITWLKPVIATRLPIVEALFRRFGDIGYLCSDEAAMRAALETAVTTLDTARYQRQVEAIHAVRASRSPGALAAEYRAQMQQQFAGLLRG
jgi:glycosyltransferase involved in cell wall biosynthesis